LAAWLVKMVGPDMRYAPPIMTSARREAALMRSVRSGIFEKVRGSFIETTGIVAFSPLSTVISI
jgi:hypothetical protein